MRRKNIQFRAVSFVLSCFPKIPIKVFYLVLPGTIWRAEQKEKKKKEKKSSLYQIENMKRKNI